MKAQGISLTGFLGRAGIALSLAGIAAALSMAAPIGAARPTVYAPETIQGFAHDPDGSASVGAVVVLTNLTSGMGRSTTVDRNGGFFFFDVPSGSYSIELDSNSGKMVRDFVFVESPGAGTTISLRLWGTGSADPAAAGSFQMRKTNPTLMGQLALIVGN